MKNIATFGVWIFNLLDNCVFWVSSKIYKIYSTVESFMQLIQVAGSEPSMEKWIRWAIW